MPEMNRGSKSSTEENTSRRRPPAWVFDEQTGWINVNEFLSRTAKLRKELVDRKKNTCKKR